MRFAIVFAAIVVDGCCCGVYREVRVDGTGCWIDAYNCRKTIFTHLSSTPCPPDVACQVMACTTTADCADAGASCGAALMCGAGTVFGGGTVACSVTDGGAGGSCVLTEGSPGC